jgi:hypothetical protein
VAERERAGVPWVTVSLGGLFLAQGLGKLADVSGYVEALARFPLVPVATARRVGLAWLGLELATGGALLALGLARRRGVVLRLAAAAAVLIAVAYATLAFHGYFAGAHVPNCTCFGVYLPQRLGMWVLLQEVVMLWWTGRHLVRATR